MNISYIDNNSLLLSQIYLQKVLKKCMKYLSWKMIDVRNTR